MARGDAKVAAAYLKNEGDGDYNNGSDTFSYSLVSNSYASIDANAATLNMGGLTVVASAGAYVSGTDIANTTWTQAGDTSALDGDDLSIAADAANPVTATCLAIYNNTSAADDVVCVVDLTTDGVTPVDLTPGLTYTINSAGIYTSQANA